PLLAADLLLVDRRAVGERPGAALDLPAGDRRRVEDARDERALELGGLELLAELELVVEERGAAHAVEAEAPLVVAGAVPGVHVPVRETALDRVRLDDVDGGDALLLLQILDLDEPAAADRVRQGRDEALGRLVGAGLGGLRQLELPEGLLELLAYAVEGPVGLGRDQRPDELEREPDRARLERRQPRREAERVAPQLLVDVDLVALELGVDRVAAAAEVDEVEQREVLLELLGRD